MTMPLSGKINMGQCNAELDKLPKNKLSLGSTIVRTLAGVPTGKIKFSDLYGKSNIPPAQTFSALTTGIHTFTIKANVRYLSVSLKGGYGSGGGGDIYNGASGSVGRGIQIVVDTSKIPGANIKIDRTATVYIASAANGRSGGTGYYNGGTGGAPGPRGGSGNGGGGGGASALIISNNVIAVAGGGGGGAGAGQYGTVIPWKYTSGGGFYNNSLVNGLQSPNAGDGYSHVADGGGCGGGGGFMGTAYYPPKVLLSRTPADQYTGTIKFIEYKISESGQLLQTHGGVGVNDVFGIGGGSGLLYCLQAACTLTLLESSTEYTNAFCIIETNRETLLDASVIPLSSDKAFLVHFTYDEFYNNTPVGTDSSS